MKKTVIVLVGLLILGGAVVLYLTRNIDDIVKRVIESEGSRVTGTTVTVGSVETLLRSGKATIRDFRISNPEGFSDGAMLAIGEITASVDYRTGAIRDLQLTRPTIKVELRGRKNNFKAVQDHIDSLSVEADSPSVDSAPEAGGAEPAAQSEPAESGSAEVTEADAEEQIQIQVDNFDLRDVEVAYNAVDFDQTGSVHVALISFSGLKGPVDVVIRQAIEQLSRQVVSSALAAVGESERVNREIDRAREKIDKHAEELGDVLGVEGDKLKKEAERVLDDLKGLFK